MKKKGKKIIAWCLLIALSATSMPAELPLMKEHYVKSVEAATDIVKSEGFIFKVDGKSAEVAGYTGEDEVVTVPNTVEGVPVVAVAAYAFQGDTKIKKLSFGSNLKEIKEYALAKMSKLEELVIPGNVTTIADNAIVTNSALKKLIFKNGQKELKLSSTMFGTTADRGAELGGLEYLELGKHVSFSNEKFLSKAPYLKEIVVDAENPYFVVKYNILFNKEETILIKGFYQPKFLGIPATVERIADGALDACAGVDWVSVEGGEPTGSDAFAVFGTTALFYYPEDKPEWNTVSSLKMADTMRIKITKDMQWVKDTIADISLPKLQLDMQEDIKKVRTLYNGMNQFQTTWVDDLCDISMLGKAEEWMVGLEVKNIVSQLPDPADITIADKTKIESAGEKYDKLTEIGKEALGTELNYKLRLARKKLHDIQQVSSIIPDKQTVEGQVGERIQVKVNIQPFYAINTNFKYKSMDDQIAGSSKAKDGSGFFVDLKKPGETEIVAQAIDSETENSENPVVTAEMRVPVLVRLQAPKGVSVKALYNASAEISWSAVQGATAYEIYRSADGENNTYIGSTTTCDKVDSGLNPDVNYTYEVIAVCANRKCNSEKSDGVSCHIQMGTVSDLTATAEGGAGATLTWTQSLGAVKYEVYRNNFATGNFTYLGETAQTSYHDAAAVDGSTYYYKVVGVSLKGNKGNESNVAKVTVPWKKSAGVTLQIKKAGTKSIQISWSQIAGAERYCVYRSTSANGTYENLGVVASASYVDNKISNGKTYYYKVIAQSATGEEVSELSDSVFLCVPAKIKSAKAVRKTKKSAKLTWKKVSGATGYEIYRSTNKKKGFKKIKTVKNGKTLKDGSDFEYSVKLKEGINTITLDPTKTNPDMEMQTYEVAYYAPASGLEVRTDLEDGWESPNPAFTFLAYAISNQGNAKLTVKIEDKTVKAGANNYYKVTLKEGENIIYLQADDGVEELSYTFSIIYNPVGRDDAQPDDDTDKGDKEEEENPLAPTLKTTLVDGATIKGSNKNFTAWAYDYNGKKLGSDYILVRVNGSKKNASLVWDDNNKTSYRLKLTPGENKVTFTVVDTEGNMAEYMYIIYSESVASGEAIGSVMFSLEADSLCLDYLIPPTKVDIYEGETSDQALRRFLSANGYECISSGSGSSFYLVGVANSALFKNEAPMIASWANSAVGKAGGTVENHYESGYLREKDFGPGSGWLFAINEEVTNYGFGDAYLQDGDIVRIRYTLYMGVEFDWDTSF